MVKAPRIGVEEEFLLVDAGTGRLVPRVESVRAEDDGAEKELMRSQVEIQTEPASTLAEMADRLTARRREVAEAARSKGTLVIASGTYPGPVDEAGRLLSTDKRHRAVAATNVVLAREQLTCGCHVHVEVEDDDERVRVVDRIHRYLPALLALSANSPYWEGQDTGFASYRSEQWARWTTAGAPGRFGRIDVYHDVVDKLIAADVILDEGMIYWPARLSRTFPTVEVRVADVCLTVDDVATVAGLARALVVDCLTTDEPMPDLRPEWLRGAAWLAARKGLQGHLMDPATGDTSPAEEYFAALLERLSPSLAATGDQEIVERGVERIFRTGTGADRQRQAAGSGLNVRHVIDLATV